MLGGGLVLEYAEGSFRMRFEKAAGRDISAGRGLRYQAIDGLDNVKILADASSVEVFINDGEYVFSTRYYPDEYTLEIEAEKARIELYRLV